MQGGPKACYIPPVPGVGLCRSTSPIRPPPRGEGTSLCPWAKAYCRVLGEAEAFFMSKVPLCTSQHAGWCSLVAA